MKNVHVPPNLYKELMAQAERTDRTVGWLLQYAWDAAQKIISELPTIKKVEEPG